MLLHCERVVNKSYTYTKCLKQQILPDMLRIFMRIGETPLTRPCQDCRCPSAGTKPVVYAEALQCKCVCSVCAVA